MSQGARFRQWGQQGHDSDRHAEERGAATFIWVFACDNACQRITRIPILCPHLQVYIVGKRMSQRCTIEEYGAALATFFVRSFPLVRSWPHGCRVYPSAGQAQGMGVLYGTS